MDLLIDTSVFIAWERERKVSLEDFAQRSVFLATVTASELLHGVYRAQSALIRERRRAFVEAILERVPSLPFALEEARVHAQIWADLSASEQKIGAHDLQIAATALVHNLCLLTHNLRDFRRIPGLALQEV